MNYFTEFLTWKQWIELFFIHIREYQFNLSSYIYQLKPLIWFRIKWFYKLNISKMNISKQMDFSFFTYLVIYFLSSLNVKFHLKSFSNHTFLNFCFIVLKLECRVLMSVIYFNKVHETRRRIELSISLIIFYTKHNNLVS